MVIKLQIVHIRLCGPPYASPRHHRSAYRVSADIYENNLVFIYNLFPWNAVSRCGYLMNCAKNSIWLTNIKYVICVSTRFVLLFQLTHSSPLSIWFGLSHDLHEYITFSQFWEMCRVLSRKFPLDTNCIRMVYTLNFINSRSVSL